MSSYKCDRCRDTGWILKLEEDSAPIAVSCGCREMEKVKNQWMAAGINPEQSSQTFSNFEVWNLSSQKAKNTAIAYYKEFDTILKSRKNSILFCGQVGSGKTHCTNCF